MAHFTHTLRPGLRQNPDGVLTRARASKPHAAARVPFLIKCTTHDAASQTKAVPAPPGGLDARFREAYTMSQVYVKDRPAPIPLSEHEARRKRKELQELTEAGKRKGVPADVIKANLEQMDQLLPDLVNLHRANAKDWVAIISDVGAVMSKLLVLRDLFPKANLYKIVSQKPKILLKSEEQLQEDGKQVLQALSAAPDPDAIIEAVPDLINPVNLARSLASIKSAFGGDPVQMLAREPQILNNMGEASIEDSAEYGELSTKD